jgi:hypothetical protein
MLEINHFNKRTFVSAVREAMGKRTTWFVELLKFCQYVRLHRAVAKGKVECISGFIPLKGIKRGVLFMAQWMCRRAALIMCHTEPGPESGERMKPNEMSQS